MLQVVQPNDQPSWQSRTTDVFLKQLAEFCVEKLPVDLIGKLEERMLPVENLVEARLEQITLVLLGRRVSGVA